MFEELSDDTHEADRTPPLSFVDWRPLGWMRCTLWLLLLVPLVSGCTRVRAKTVPAGPPLDVPAPPPRVVEPVVVEPVAVEAPAPLPAPLPEEPRRAPARPRPAPPAEVPKAADEPQRPPSPAPPPPALQRAPAAEQGEEERAIRGTMARASGDLNRIDYRALNADARTQYDTAKRFIQQAEDAIRLKNLVFAKNLADKAAVLAAQLAGK